MKPNHFTRPKERGFFASERADTTILFGGLTEAHEEMVLGHMQGLGYKVERLPVPDFDGLLTGKEYCNRGQCNPTYYTAGNLVRYLKSLCEKMPKEEVEKKYVYFTAGSCGPCRFGMYESEYRKAVVDAGFTNFRVLIFQQAGGLQSLGAQEGPGLDFNKDFFVGLIKAILIGDLLNGMVNKIRPYEMVPGATMAAKRKAMGICQEALRQRQNIFKSLKEARQVFHAVECDYTLIKPVVKITGEFWASITEGQGNYFLKEWLWNEGAEVVNEPLTGWIEHLLFSREIKARDRQGIEQDVRGLGVGANPYKNEFKLFAYRRILNGYYNLYRSAFGFKPNNTVNNRVLARLAHQYYDKRQGGGEAYMEVGHLVHIGQKAKAHLMISVKPFGCLPSTASDGVQTKVMSDYPNIIFLPLETSGDSEVHFKSRAQMKLFEAKQKARDEADKMIKKKDINADAVRAFVRRHPAYRSGALRFKQRFTGTGISFLSEMNQRMKSPLGKLKHQLSRRVFQKTGIHWP